MLLVSCSKVKNDSHGQINYKEPIAVDLGLSVKWANANLGATKPEEYGGYYQWAGTDNVSDTSINLWLESCPYHTGSSFDEGWTKYVTLEEYGTIDNKITLEASDDAATVHLGGTWRMPTETEWRELVGKCHLTWITLNGVNGLKIQSKKTGYTDNWIFLPAAGYRDGDNLGSAGFHGCYWTSSINKGCSSGAHSGLITAEGSGGYIHGRYEGLSVRPVSE